MADSDTEQNETKLKSTLDQIQKRFFCGTEEITIWRNALIYRYLAIADRSLSVGITDYDKNDAILTSVPYLVPLQIPPQLAKTVIRLMHGSSKCVTITLFFTQQSGGTLLCQGRDCDQWGKLECESIKHFVTDFMDNKNKELLDKSLLDTPLSFIKNISGTATLRPPPIDLASVHSSSKISNDHPSDAQSPTQSPDSRLLLSCEIANAARGSSQTPILLPPTPPVSRQAENEISPEKQDKKTTPVSKRTRNQRKRTLFSAGVKSRNKRSSATNIANWQGLAQMRDSIETLTSAQTDFESQFSSLLEDLKISVKNELRMNISEKFNSLFVELETTNSRIDQLEEKNSKLEKENHSIKTQLGTLQSQFKRFSSKKMTTAATQTTPHPSHEECTVSPVKSPPQSDQGAHSSKEKTGYTEKQLADLSQQTNVSTKADHSVSVKASESDIQGPPESDQCAHSSKEKTTEYTEKQLADLSQQTNVSTKADYSVSVKASESDIQGPTLHYNVPVANSFQVLSELDTSNLENDVCDESNAKGNFPDQGKSVDYSENSVKSTVKISSKETLSKIFVPDRATMLLIGDSVIRNIGPIRLAPQGEKMFKVCVPGMNVDDLLSWLYSGPVLTKIRCAIIHVGVNSCPSGAITEEQWSDLINQCTISLPQSSINMSSIVPARGRHHLNNSILSSNRNLQAVCHHLNVSFIDHTSTFMASSGAPRLALYSNLTHPSDRGTARLANNMRSIWYNNGRSVLARYKTRNARATAPSQDVNDVRRGPLPDALHNIHFPAARLHPPHDDHCRQPQPDNATHDTYPSHVYLPQCDNQNNRQPRMAYVGDYAQQGHPPLQTSDTSGRVPCDTRVHDMQSEPASCPPPSSLLHFPTLTRNQKNPSDIHPSFRYPNDLPDHRHDRLPPQYPRPMPSRDDRPSFNNLPNHRHDRIPPQSFHHPNNLPDHRQDRLPPQYPRPVPSHDTPNKTFPFPNHEPEHQMPYRQNPTDGPPVREYIHPYALGLLSMFSQLMTQQFQSNMPFQYIQ